MTCDDKAKAARSSGPSANFRIFSTAGDGGEINGVPFYFIESTAPNNVELVDPPEEFTPPVLKLWDDPAAAVRDIAHKLIDVEKDVVETSLIVMAHGYNSPRSSVLATYYNAIKALKQDQAAIFSKSRRVVCVGYRWPSEGLGTIWPSGLAALPLFPLWLLIGSAIVLLLRITDAFLQLPWIIGYAAQLLAPLAVFFAAIVLFMMLLRVVVYFRDIYRATNYGVQDLVEVIRQIDVEASKLVEARGVKNRRRIALSFVGHSMGGLVVTNVIRVLADVFDPAVIRTDLSNVKRARAAITDEQLRSHQVTANIGHVFSLMRFVLASPDIPAEALLAARGNFLESALARFKEAYLFSSEGDEVLRLISTTANYFSFPTTQRTWGYRLGNLEILSSGFDAIRSDGGGDLLKTLRVGYKTLEQLSDSPSAADVGDAARVADAFTYFDCTDYIDDRPEKRSYLTEAKNYKASDRYAGIPYFEHLKLLLRFLSNDPEKHINVHGGYFEGEVTQRVIYRLACLGYDDTVEAYKGEAQMLTECSAHQIRVMLSTRLDEKLKAQRKYRELMETAAIARELRAEIDALRERSIDGEASPLHIPTGSPPSDGIREEGDMLVIGDVRVAVKRES